ncbi:hypothetical protein J3Q64DRAFT_1763925 [Phycomyces blakesleeanus]|uniref:Uncharacterized protein n=1 Tax=Phycomyces blakesleeanus TaxID=4837 RepID=A0ABR3ANY8_PHYBL
MSTMTNGDPDYVLQAQVETETTETIEIASKSLKEKAHITFDHINNCLREHGMTPAEATRFVDNLQQNLENSISAFSANSMSLIRKRVESISKKKSDNSKFVALKLSILDMEKSLDFSREECIISMEKANSKALSLLEPNSIRLHNLEESVIKHITEATKEAIIKEIDTLSGEREETDKQIKENSKNSAAMDILDHHMERSRVIKELRSSIESKNIFQSPSEVKKWEIEIGKVRSGIEEQQNNQREMENTIEEFQSKNTIQHGSQPRNLKKLEEDLQVLTKALHLAELEVLRVDVKVENDSDVSDSGFNIPQKRSRTISSKDNHTVKERLDHVEDKQKDLLSFLSDHSKTSLDTAFPHNLESTFKQFNEKLSNHETILGYLLNPVEANHRSPKQTLQEASIVLNSNTTGDKATQPVSSAMLKVLRRIVDKTVENANDQMWSKVRKLEKEVLMIDRKNEEQGKRRKTEKS